MMFCICHGLQVRAIWLTFSDQLYSDLAWGGLQGTNAWNNMYVDANYTKNEQTRIKTAILNFIKSSNNECN